MSNNNQAIIMKMLKRILLIGLLLTLTGCAHHARHLAGHSLGGSYGISVNHYSPFRHYSAHNNYRHDDYSHDRYAHKPYRHHNKHHYDYDDHYYVYKPKFKSHSKHRRHNHNKHSRGHRGRRFW